MTVTVEASRAPLVRDERPALSDAASIITLGQLAWLAWVWLTVTVIYGIVLAAVARWGEVDESLWQSIVAGWQRWLLFSCGVVAMTMFMRMLVRNGATRALFSSAVAVAMAVIAACSTALVTAGFAVERLVYDRYDWPQEVGTGTLLEWSDLSRVAIEFTIAGLAYFVSGWLVGAGFCRFGPAGGVAFILPSLIPVGLCELTLSTDFSGAYDDSLRAWSDRPHLLVVTVVGTAIVLAGAWTARRITHATPVR
jgi:hypothetical protein